MTLAVRIYGLTESFPPSERFGLTSQMRRAAISVPSNIAEGYGRGSSADFARFVRHSLGSMFELRTQVELARRLTLVDGKSAEDLTADLTRLSKQIDSFLRHLDARRNTPPTPDR